MSTKPFDCCLTIICHESLEERLIDFLLEHPEWITGFSIGRIEGHSQKERLPSTLEQVRGRSRRVEMRAVMNLMDAKALVSQLGQQERNRDVAYWISPVIEFGRVAIERRKAPR